MSQLPPYKPRGVWTGKGSEMISFGDVAEVWDGFVEGLKHPNLPLEQPPHPGARQGIQHRAGHGGGTSQETPPSFSPKIGYWEALGCPPKAG